MPGTYRAHLQIIGFTAMALAGCAESITSPGASSMVARSILLGVDAVGELSAGGYHTCSLKTDGVVICWGRNFSGQATPPAGLIAVQVSGGHNHVCALKPDGTIVCWGYNGNGQTVVPAGVMASHVGSGAEHTCAVRIDGTVVCWGDNSKGQSTVPAGLNSVARVVSGLDHTCALKTDGSVVCWGSNFNNQLAVPAGLSAVELSGQWLHVCAVQASGTPACWGYGPLAAMPVGILATEISPGNAHNCALRTDATVTCWGYNAQPLPEAWAQYGQTTVPAGLNSVAHVSSGSFHTCALKTDGTVVCWGLNDTGQTDVPSGLNLITTQAQSIVFTSTAPLPALVGESFIVTATGGGSGNPVTFASLTLATCLVTGSTAEFLAAGTCTVAADQAGNANYFAAPQVTQSMTVVVPNVAPVVSAITLPPDPIAVNATIAITAQFTDGNTLDTHTGTLSWGDAATTVGTVSEASGAGTLTDGHAYDVAGVYTIGVSVNDGSLIGTRSSVLDVPAYVVVFDPSAGFVTGGGWITSPAGAYATDPALTGKASFGFVSRYQKGATTPSGNTEFQFHAGGFEFSSSTYQWLVVAGAKAQFKGTGAVNGSGNYGFMLSAIDGQENGGGGIDRFRIKIWNVATGQVVYDNQMGAAEDAEATTAVGGGSIVIHK